MHYDWLREILAVNLRARSMLASSKPHSCYNAWRSAPQPYLLSIVMCAQGPIQCANIVTSNEHLRECRLAVGCQKYFQLVVPHRTHCWPVQPVTQDSLPPACSRPGCLQLVVQHRKHCGPHIQQHMIKTTVPSV